jgi:hypothetical protein
MSAGARSALPWPAQSRLTQAIPPLWSGIPQRIGADAAAIGARCQSARRSPPAEPTPRSSSSGLSPGLGSKTITSHFQEPTIPRPLNHLHRMTLIERARTMIDRQESRKRDGIDVTGFGSTGEGNRLCPSAVEATRSESRAA